jgi:hypothetical protein
VRARKKNGSVVFNKARSTWNLLWVENGTRRSRRLGTLTELPTRADALQRADSLRRELRLQQQRSIVTVKQLVEQYRAEKMPKRSDTRRAYEVWLRNHILPRWSDSVVTNLAGTPGGTLVGLFDACTQEQGTFAVCLASCGTLQCGEEMFRHNAIRWSWSASKV